MVRRLRVWRKNNTKNGLEKNETSYDEKESWAGNAVSHISCYSFCVREKKKCIDILIKLKEDKKRNTAERRRKTFRTLILKII